MNEKLECTISRIHDSNVKAVLCVSGVGTKAIAWLLEIPGASNTILEGIIPYSQHSLIDFMGITPSNSVSEETSQKMARASWKGSGDKKIDDFWLNILNLIPPTKFMGYSNLELSGIVLSIVFNSSQVNEISEKNDCEIIFNQTPFYAESGGQESDHGIIKTKDCEAIVKGCWKTNNCIFVHIPNFASYQPELLNFCLQRL